METAKQTNEQGDNMKLTYEITDKQNREIETIELIVKKSDGVLMMSNNFISFRCQTNRALSLGEYGCIVVSHIKDNTMYGRKLNSFTGKLSYGNYDLSEVINFKQI